MSRKKMEEKYGAFGEGARVVFIGDLPYSVSGILKKIGLLQEGIIGVDCGMCEEGTFFVRFVDLDDRRVATIEFTDTFRLRSEMRADLVDWLGDEYFRMKWRVFCPGDPEHWMGEDPAMKKR